MVVERRLVLFGRDFPFRLLQLALPGRLALFGFGLGLLPQLVVRDFPREVAAAVC